MAEFFISYTKADQAWAEWIAWQLRQRGDSVRMQDSDFRPGPSVPAQIDAALGDSEMTIAVVSSAYFQSQWCNAEWHAAFSMEQEGKGYQLLPVQIKAAEFPPLMKSKSRIALLDLDEAEARKLLLQAVDGAKGPPATPVEFPGSKTKSGDPPPKFPGTSPDVCTIPHDRNRNFTGRDDLLEQLRQALISGKPAALVQALHGLGGIGKTQTAVEYAYRHLGDDGFFLPLGETPTVEQIRCTCDREPRYFPKQHYCWSCDDANWS